MLFNGEDYRIISIPVAKQGILMIPLGKIYNSFVLIMSWLRLVTLMIENIFGGAR